MDNPEKFQSAGDGKLKAKFDIVDNKVIDLETKMNTAPCPCEWGNWSVWSGCSTTCEAGKSHRGRVIAKAAINDGKDCEGPASEEKICNQDVCCRKLKQDEIQNSLA